MTAQDYQQLQDELSEFDEDNADSGLECYFCLKGITYTPRWIFLGSEQRPCHEVCRQEFISGADDHPDWDDDLEYDDEYRDAMENAPEWYK